MSELSVDPGWKNVASEMVYMVGNLTQGNLLVTCCFKTICLVTQSDDLEFNATMDGKPVKLF